MDLRITHILFIELQDKEINGNFQDLLESFFVTKYTLLLI